jgi:HK97 family phage portal protein
VASNLAEAVFRAIKRPFVRAEARSMSSVDGTPGWFNIIREPWSGAWQRNLAADGPRDVLAFSAVFSCVTLIAGDIAKLRIKLIQEDENGICTEIKTGSPRLPVLRKPNRYQTRIKFMQQWIVSKMIHGNAFALKERKDARGIVTALYILNPERVKIKVTDDGGVYYELDADHLSQIHEKIIVPASEIIHDSMIGLWHPLMGTSPIYACGMSSTMGNRIQGNSARFFENMSRPSGTLTAPDNIPDDVAARVKTQWEENYGGANLGRVAVLGSGLKYEAMTIPAQAAQLIEQLKFTVEDVARCFHVPIYKLGGPVPVNNSVESLNQGYYSDCLHELIESAEAALDEGLELPAGQYTEFDLDGLLRMDTAARYDALSKLVGAGVMAPNEARGKENLKPVKGGELPYLQQQNWQLGQLADRKAPDDVPTDQGRPDRTAAPDDGEDYAQNRLAEDLANRFIQGLSALHVA